MGIGSITSMNSISGMQMTMAGSTDAKSKSIQNKITGVQQQMRKLSSKEELSVNEKANERKKLQKEISNLNTELKQQQQEFRKSQRRELMMAELQEEKKPAKEGTTEDKIQTPKTSLDRADGSKEKEQANRQGTVISQNNDGLVVLKEEINRDEKHGVNTENKQADDGKEKAISKKEAGTADSDKDTYTGMSSKRMNAIVSANTSVQQATQQETVIARIRGGIAILKEEISQDKESGADTEKKQAELEKMEKKEQRARAIQSSILADANSKMTSSAKTDVPGTKDSVQGSTENNVLINAFNLSTEDGQLTPQFYVAF